MNFLLPIFSENMLSSAPLPSTGEVGTTRNRGEGGDNVILLVTFASNYHLSPSHFQ
jgi:hypothetical protein